MRNTIIMLLVLLLALLVYIASCGPQQEKETSAEKAAVVETPANALTAKAAASTAPNVANSVVQRARTALASGGFGALTVESVDGSLLLRGDVASPADRVRAGRALAELGMPVINHVRAKKPVEAKPLALTLEKRNGQVIARGDVTAAIHQSLKQRFSLSAQSAINETTISTPNAGGAFQVAAYGLAGLKEGAVQVVGTRISVNGESVGDSQALRTTLNRQLPRGYSLTSNIVNASKPVVKPVAKPAVVTRPVASAAQRWSQPVTAVVEPEVAIAETLPVVESYRAAVADTYSAATETVVNVVATQRPVKASAYDDYAIAETFPLESGEVVDYSTGHVISSSAVEPSLAVAETYVDSSVDTSRYEPVYRSVSVVSEASTGVAIDDSCDSPSLNLMPNGTIRFFHNSAQLTHKSRSRMELATGILLRCPQLEVEVAGHTDVTGSNDTNGGISQARADRIYLYLVNHGVSPDRLRVASYGDSQPAHPNDSKFGRAMNRRVELVIR